ncbi:MAG: hypothetical protein SRB1_02552 [Desulfobacteraceae bacterium Eth-SRB1]|nr:MAG: hypothetical protein SRB1_02552 [Desulfobacteraceae bacterium Eth-SRB1]
MIINKVEVRTKGKNYSGIISLTLVKKEDGWTYEVGNMTMTGDDLPLIWRTKTREQASRKLRDIYKDEIWDFKIIE